jgi:hypothetical protein
MQRAKPRGRPWTCPWDGEGFRARRRVSRRPLASGHVYLPHRDGAGERDRERLRRQSCARDVSRLVPCGHGPRRLRARRAHVQMSERSLSGRPRPERLRLLSGRRAWLSGIHRVSAVTSLSVVGLQLRRSARASIRILFVHQDPRDLHGRYVRKLALPPTGRRLRNDQHAGGPVHGGRRSVSGILERLLRLGLRHSSAGVPLSG